MKAKPNKVRILKIQRPIFPSRNKKLLIYSIDSEIPPRLVEDSGQWQKAIGNRCKVYYTYTLTPSNCVLLGHEVFYHEA